MKFPGKKENPSWMKVRQANDAMMKDLADILPKMKKSTEMPDNFLCSSCFQGAPMDDIHVLPWWNETYNTFFTTYRCHVCWLRSLAETRLKLENAPLEVREDFAQFLLRYKQDKLAKAYLTAPPEEAERIANHFLDELEANPKILFVSPDMIKNLFRPRP